MKAILDVLNLILIGCVYLFAGIYLFYLIRDFFRCKWWKSFVFWGLGVLLVALGTVAHSVLNTYNELPTNTVAGTIFVFTFVFGLIFSIPVAHYTYHSWKKEK